MSTVDMKASEAHPMEMFVGTKVVFARPMTRGEYNDYRGWPIPNNENPADEGYFVEYPGTVPCDERHAGYISWSPKIAFEESHFVITENPTNPTLHYFAYAHLPPHLQSISKLCALLAQQMDAMLPEGAQKTLGLQKLIEAKDCFVRAKLPQK